MSQQGARVFGSKETFGVEYLPEETGRRAGGISFWFSGRWLGELENPIMLDIVAYRLVTLLGARRAASLLLFKDDASVPSFEALASQAHWSFGEPFDDFTFVYYAIAETQTVHWAWRRVSASSGAGLRGFRCQVSPHRIRTGSSVLPRKIQRSSGFGP